MAARDKTHEFYINASRFAFLADAYRPENLPKEVNEAMSLLVNFFNNDTEFMVKVDEAKEYFQELRDQIEMCKRKDLLAELVRECSR